VNLILLNFGQRIFAVFLSNFVEKYNGMADPFKKKLFKELNQIKATDGKVKILEIGGGSGANFKYYTSPAVVDVVEPNPNFAPYWDKNKALFNKLQINDVKQGYGEDLLSAGIADSSVDAVVMTLVLCSVNDQVKCLKEIQRVLKPGGKFFFMEHIIAEQGDNIRFAQQALMQGGFWPACFDGCHLDRDTPATINSTGGWSGLDMTKYQHPSNPNADLFMKIVGSLVKPHVMGVAVK